MTSRSTDVRASSMILAGQVGGLAKAVGFGGEAGGNSIAEAVFDPRRVTMPSDQTTAGSAAPGGSPDPAPDHSFTLPFVVGLGSLLLVSLIAGVTFGRVGQGGAPPDIVMQYQEELAVEAAQNVRRGLNEGVSDVAQLAAVWASEGRPIESVPTSILTDVHNRYTSVFVELVDRPPIAIAGSKRIEAVEGDPPIKPGILPIRPGRIRRTPVIHQVAPLPAEGTLLVGQYNPAFLRFALLDGAAGDAWIVDRRGRVISATVGFVAFGELPEGRLLRAARRTRNGAAGVEVSGSGRRRDLVAWAPVTGEGPAGQLGLSVVTRRSVASLGLPANDARREGLVFAIVTAAVAAGVYGWLWLVIVVPLRRLRAEAERISGGDLVAAVTILRYDEIGLASRALERLRVLLVSEAAVSRAPQDGWAGLRPTLEREPDRAPAPAPAPAAPAPTPRPHAWRAPGGKKRTYRLASSIRLPLGMGLAALLVVALGAGVLVGRVDDGDLAVPGAVREAQAAVAVEVEESIRRGLNEGLDDVDQLAAELESVNDPAAALTAFASVHGRYLSVYLLDPGGAVVAQAGARTDLSLLPDPTAVNPPMRIVLRSDVALLAQRARVKGSERSVVAFYDPQFLRRAMSVAGRGDAWVVDRNGKIVTGLAAAPLAKILPRADLAHAATQATAGHAGVAVASGGALSRDVTAWRPVRGVGVAGGLGWAVVATRRVDAAGLSATGARPLALGWAFAFVLVSLIVLGWFRLTVVQPLLHLQSEAERLAYGDLSASVDIPRDDEIGMIAHSFERIRVQLIRGHLGAGH